MLQRTKISELACMNFCRVLCKNETTELQLVEFKVQLRTVMQILQLQTVFYVMKYFEICLIELIDLIETPVLQTATLCITLKIEI